MGWNSGTRFDLPEAKHPGLADRLGRSRQKRKTPPPLKGALQDRPGWHKSWHYISEKNLRAVLDG